MRINETIPILEGLSQNFISVSYIMDWGQISVKEPPMIKFCSFLVPINPNVPHFYIMFADHI